MVAAPRSPRRLVLLALALVVSTVVALVLSPSGNSPNAPIRAPLPPSVPSEPRRLRRRLELCTVLRAAVTSQRAARVHLVVRVFSGHRVIRTVRQPLRVAGGGRVTRARVAIRTHSRAPRMTVRLSATDRRTDGIRMHRVRWIHRPAAGRLKNGCRYGQPRHPGLWGVPRSDVRRQRRPGAVREALRPQAGHPSLLLPCRPGLLGGRRGPRRPGARAAAVGSFKLPTSSERGGRGCRRHLGRQLVKRFERLDGPVWLAFHHEPE